MAAASDDLNGQHNDSAGHGDSYDLEERISNFYRKKVAIDEAEVKRNDAIFNGIISDLQKNLEVNFAFGKPILRGSAGEGLKIIRQDEYDVLMPLKISESHWECVQYPHDSRYVKLEERGKDENIPDQLRMDNCLNAAAVWSKCLGAVQKFANYYNAESSGTHKIRVSSHGPAITIHVTDHKGLIFDADLIPMVKVGDNWLISKRHPNAVNMPNARETPLWRKSFTHKETDALAKIPPKNKKVLKIAKAIRQAKGSPMNSMCSYIYKTDFLHFYNKQTDAERKAPINAQVKAYFSHLASSLKTGHMSPYHDSKGTENLLASQKPINLQNVGFNRVTLFILEVGVKLEIVHWNVVDYNEAAKTYKIRSEIKGIDQN
ncbi:hypothetical protein CAPTEDRAFT_189416 [Capitella teleta]|uniref:Mab-21-like nucleotidyltransferase domain-containing protein n=1 Tax=Capitella teleta TaxID=283909 RepID=R7VGW7_CAPTE|nr:hypothetical protein CAPTEDRAFT_189416 [Capitella teleta]|eukprot:ELU15551.1 hypothetical protein CAPTEDRAFT_189416 [Capitella teleta]